MEFRSNSIGLKISVLYILLALVNMALFSIIIYENQIDLIIENTKNHAMKLTEEMIFSIKKISSEIDDMGIFKADNREDVIKEIAELAKRKTHDFVIFTEDGTPLHQSSPGISVTKEDVMNGIKAMTNMDFTGKQYYTTVDEENYEISFYVPFKVHLIEDSILFLKIKMQEIGHRLSNLYKLIVFIIVVIGVFHGVFAFMLFRFFISPIQNLYKKSIEISNGNYDARADIKQKDEIGALGNAFNSMAASIQEKITTLQRQNQIMEYELDLASGVQKIIYPKFKKNTRFNFSVYHKASGKVSGDYYDVFKIRESEFGFLILDVTGHGVPAALYTMIAKEMFRRQALKYPVPSDLFKNVNAEIFDILDTSESDGSTFFSAFYFTINKDNIISYCNAGHNQPYLIKVKEKMIHKLDTNGFLIGISKDSDGVYETKKEKVEKGDKIILFTDGIIEPRNENSEQYGTKRLIKAIASNFENTSDKILKSIINDLGRFTDINRLPDDATIFIIEIK